MIVLYIYIIIYRFDVAYLIIIPYEHVLWSHPGCMIIRDRVGMEGLSLD